MTGFKDNGDMLAFFFLHFSQSSELYSSFEHFSSQRPLFCSHASSLFNSHSINKQNLPSVTFCSCHLRDPDTLGLNTPGHVDNGTQSRSLVPYILVLWLREDGATVGHPSSICSSELPPVGSGVASSRTAFHCPELSPTSSSGMAPFPVSPLLLHHPPCFPILSTPLKS